MGLFDFATYEYEFGTKFKKILDGVGIEDYGTELGPSHYRDIEGYMSKHCDIVADKCFKSIHEIIKQLLKTNSKITIFPDIISIYLESAEKSGIHISVNMNTEFKILSKIFNK